MTILFSSDHAGFDLKAVLLPYVKELGFDADDLGPYEKIENDDYPDWISKVAEKVSKSPYTFKGIIIGGSGQGEAIVANRHPNVRAVVFNGQYAPEDGREMPDEIITSREHNDANILSIGARFINEDEAKEAVKKWLTTEFSGEERHVRRIKKIEDYPKADKRAW